MATMHAAMCSIAKSAVRQTFRLASANFINPKLVRHNSTKMSNWESDKEKFLTMSIKEKQITQYTPLSELASWEEYAKIKKLPPVIEKLPGKEIDNAKNQTLAKKISIFLGDITKLEVDAIVNAANSSLRGGGGVDGAIHRAAGKSLVAECITLGGCPTGEAKMTGGYKLPAKYVIHTVGPQGEKPDLLKNCYVNSLNVLLSKKLRSIAFPCISTGIYGYPNLAAAHVAAHAVRKILEANTDAIDRVVFCLFLDTDKEIYEGLLQSYFPFK